MHLPVEGNISETGERKTATKFVNTTCVIGRSELSVKQKPPGRNRKKVKQTMGETVAFPRMGTIKEAASASGLAVYRIRRLVASGKIRYIRAGRHILVNMDSLARYLNTGDQPEPINPGGMQRIIE